MTLDTLIKYLEDIKKNYGTGSLEIDIVTETDKTGQVEQPLGDLAVSSREKRVKLLPEGF